ncbi:MAG: hypothetical protein RL011_616 [Pseudomonadota bacterium]
MHSPLKETYVVKIGGAAVDRCDVADELMHQVRKCRDAGVRLVLVHGGGDRLTEVASSLGVEAPFINGRRVTNDSLIDVAKMVFAGGVGTDLAAAAHRAGVSAIAISGVSAGLIEVVRRPMVHGVDYGWVGDITQVNKSLIWDLLNAGLTPLVASLGVDNQGFVYNVNADTIACRLAVALKAHKLIILTGPDGVLRNVDDPMSRVEQIAAADILENNLDFDVSGGMLPKLASLAAATIEGVKSVHVASWRRPEVLAQCIGNQPGHIGTRIDGPRWAS